MLQYQHGHKLIQNIENKCIDRTKYIIKISDTINEKLVLNMQQMSPIADTPKPPYYAVIFTSKKLMKTKAIVKCR